MTRTSPPPDSDERPPAADRRPGLVDCAVYVDGHRLPGTPTPGEAKDLAEREGGFAWVGLFEPDLAELSRIAEVFDLPELGVHNAVRAHQRPKLERFREGLFLVLKTVKHVAHTSAASASEIVETGEIMVFLGAGHIVTVRHRDQSRLGALRAELEAAPDRLALGPAAVLHALVDHVVDDYLAVTEAFEHDIDEVEGLVFAPRSTISPEQMHLMKRELIELRRSIAPLATPLRVLADNRALVPESISSYYRDVADHLETVAERIAGFDEILTTLLNATLAKVTLQQNNDMRRITAWAAIIAVPTLVVGVYGMNFDHMPELHWRYGYPVVLALTFAVCLVLYRSFKRNQWL
ncbi:magnesium/cobalt transporter CorA [Actinokineospora soli]